MALYVGFVRKERHEDLAKEVDGGCDLVVVTSQTIRTKMQKLRGKNSPPGGASDLAPKFKMPYFFLPFPRRVACLMKPLKYDFFIASEPKIHKPQALNLNGAYWLLLNVV